MNCPLNSYSVSPPHALRGCLSRRPDRERDSPPDLLDGVTQDVSKGFRVFVSAHPGERSGLWIDSDARPSPCLAFPPERFDRSLWNTKNSPDWRDQINGLVIFAVALIPVVNTIANLLQTSPCQGHIPVTPP